MHVLSRRHLSDMIVVVCDGVKDELVHTFEIDAALTRTSCRSIAVISGSLGVFSEDGELITHYETGACSKLDGPSSRGAGKYIAKVTSDDCSWVCANSIKHIQIDNYKQTVKDSSFKIGFWQMAYVFGGSVAQGDKIYPSGEVINGWGLVNREFHAIGEVLLYFFSSTHCLNTKKDPLAS